MAFFICNDALVKYVGQSLATTQLVFLRGVLATLLVFLVVLRTPAFARVRDLVRPRVLARAGVDAVATLCYLGSLFHLPLANATAINLASPLVIALLARALMNERVSTGRAVAIGVGFAGVLLVIRPTSDGFNAWALLCLLATVLHAIRDLLTRRIDPGIPSLVITLATAIAVTLFAGGLSLFQGWKPLRVADAGLLALAAVFLSGGYYCVVGAMRQGELALVGAFRYTGLLCALALGWVVWADVPDLLAWTGIGLLVGAGLYMLLGQRLRTPPRDSERAIFAKK